MTASHVTTALSADVWAGRSTAYFCRPPIISGTHVTFPLVICSRSMVRSVATPRLCCRCSTDVASLRLASSCWAAQNLRSASLFDMR